MYVFHFMSFASKKQTRQNKKAADFFSWQQSQSSRRGEFVFKIKKRPIPSLWDWPESSSGFHFLPGLFHQPLKECPVLGS
jgi:hypothetical protein